MSQKKCCVVSRSSEHASTRSTYEKFNSPKCQFIDYTNELYCFKNEYFCPLHLPLKSEKKKSLDVSKILECYLNGKNRRFDYINLSNKTINFKKYKEEVKGVILFRGVTLSKVTIENLTNNYITFENAFFIEDICINNFHYVDVTFYDIYLYSEFEEKLPGIISLTSYGFSIQNTTSINLKVSNSEIFTKINFCNDCVFSNVKFINSIIGSNKNYKLNLDEIKFNIGNVSIHSLEIENCDIYQTIDITTPDKINNFDLSSSTFFQAPFIRGNLLSNGSKYMPMIFNQVILGEQSKHKEKYYYNEVIKLRNLFELSKKYNLIENANHFYSLTQQCLEKTNQIDSTQKLVSKLYGVASSYGTSIRLPILWLIIFITYPYLIYTLDPAISSKSLEISILSIFKPLSFEIYKIDNAHWLSKVMNFFQNIIALPLWTFLILAFRWNFKKN